MKGVLYYFSGTGNTKWVADRFKTDFKLYNVNLNLVNIENKEMVKEECMKQYDFMVFGSPAHAEFPPRIMCDFLRDFKSKSNEIRTIVYSTQGRRTSSSSCFMSKCLKKKGYRIDVQTCIRMPNNFYFCFGRKPLKKNIDALLSDAEQKIKHIVKNFIEKDTVIESNNELRLYTGKILSRAFKSRIPKISKNMVSTDACNKCGLCLMNCPQNNITFENGHAVFHSKCLLCMRCIHICPLNAITYKNKVIDQTQKNIINSLELNT